MQYILMIHEDENQFEQLDEAAVGKMMSRYQSFGEALNAAGKMRGGERLQPVATATTVRVRDGETLLSDGPFAETKEQLGGFYMIEAKDLDEAVEWAAKIPGAEVGCVEVRPIWMMG